MDFMSQGVSHEVAHSLGIVAAMLYIGATAIADLRGEHAMDGRFALANGGHLVLAQRDGPDATDRAIRKVFWSVAALFIVQLVMIPIPLVFLWNVKQKRRQSESRRRSERHRRSTISDRFNDRYRGHTLVISNRQLPVAAARDDQGGTLLELWEEAEAIGLGDLRFF